MLKVLHIGLLGMLLAGCVQYSCDGLEGQVGGCSSFEFATSNSHNLDFGTASDYSYDQPITLISGQAVVSVLDVTDDDNNGTTGFGSGNFLQAQWDSSESAVTLTTVSSDDELPDNDATSGYINMSNTGVLLHLNDASPSDLSLLTDSGGEALTTTFYTNDSFSKGVKGVIGGGIYFDGVDDAITFDEPNDGIMDETSSVFTYMIWFKPDSGTVTDFTINGNSCVQGGQGLWNYWAQPALPNHTLVQARVGQNGVIIYELKAGWVSTVAAYEAPLTDWTHLALVSEDANNMHLYINGQLVSTAVVTANTRELNIAQLGSSDCAGPVYFNGTLDEFAVLRKALTSNEVATIYEAQRPDKRLSLPSSSANTKWFPVTGLVFNLPFDIDGGWDTTANMILDRSGNANHVTALTANDIQVPGQVGQGAYADKGSNGYYTVSNESNFDFELTDSFSLAAWFQTKDYGGGTWSGIIGKVNNNCGPGHMGYWLQMNHGDGAIYWTLATTGAAITRKTDRGYNDGRWHHIVATYDGSSTVAGLTIYMDGVQEIGSIFDPGPATGTLLNDAEVVIGSAGHGCNDSMDRLDEIAVWNRELSSDEAEAIYRVQSSRFAGAFTSRIIDSQDTSATWDSISWRPKSPYGKNLPNSNSAETAYASNNVDMADAILLFHLDETSGNYSDTSASGLTGIPNNVSQGDYGQVGRSAGFDGASSYIEIGATAALQSQDFTIAFWVQPRSINAGQVSIFDYDHAGAHNYAIQVNPGLIVYLTKFDSGSGAWETSNLYPMKRGVWQHIAITNSGTTVQMYIDGHLLEEVTHGGNGIITFANTVARLGSNTTLGRYFDGQIDEFAIFNSVLSSAQIAKLYKHGADRIFFQVRSCNDSACSGESFVGPDGTAATLYSEVNNSGLGLPSSISLVGAGLSANRYFQYQMLILGELFNTGSLPYLHSVAFGNTSGNGIPSITSNRPQQLSALTGFKETTGSNNAGTITYQISNDSGSHWYWYHNGWIQTTGGASESSSASTINSQISALPIGSGQFTFRAYLNSNNRTQLTVLDSVTFEGQ